MENESQLPEDKQWVLRNPLVRRRLGLGDLVEAAAQKMGIEPCDGCKRRKKLLNRIVLEPME